MSERQPPPPLDEIARLRAALAEERRKAEVFAALSHELRTLIAGVVGLTSLLLDTELTGEQRDYVKSMRSFSETLVGLVDDVLDDRRAEAGKLERDEPPSTRSAPKPVPLDDPRPPERPRVLLVEDNAVNQKVSRLMMERRGYVVDVAADGREAVEATAQRPYAAVLMDCQMPRLDGYAATREIRARDAMRVRVPIIAMTANAGAGARERCLSAGMDDYVSKPVTADALDAVLRRWISKAPAPAEAPAPRLRRSSPPIDLGMLRQMRATQGPDEPNIVSEVVALFIHDAPVRMQAMRDAAARGDLVLAARTSHTLKGSAGHLGAKTLSTVCTRFEEKVRAGAPFDVTFAVSAIAEELDRVLAALAVETAKT